MRDISVGCLVGLINLAFVLTGLALQGTSLVLETGIFGIRSPLITHCYQICYYP